MFLRRLVLVPLVGLLSFSVIVTLPSSASAATSVGHPLNILAATPVMSDAAQKMANEFVESGQTELSAEQRASLAGGVTTAAKPAKGFRPVPRPGMAGMVVNTVGILAAVGGFTFLGGSDDEVALPVPEMDQATGNALCGWTTVAGATIDTYCPLRNGWTNGRITFPAGTVGDNQQMMLYWPEWRQWFSCDWGEDYCTIGAQADGPRHYSKVALRHDDDVDTPEEYDALPSMGQLWIAAPGQPMQNPVGGAGPDPAVVPRYVEATANCKRPDGTFEIKTERMGPFMLAPGQQAEIPGIQQLVCPQGSWLDSGSHKLDSGAGTPKIDVIEPYKAPDWVEDNAKKYPECLPIGSESCTLRLVKISTASDRELDCNSVAASANHPCRDWHSDPNKTDKYRCMYGGNTMPMRSCEPYAKAFTSTPRYTETPAEETTPRTDVDPTPEATPGLGGCAPNWGIGLLNPFWVMKSTACALVWAFVPKGDFGLPALWNTIQTRPPGSLVVGVGLVAQSAIDRFTSSGCGDLGGIPLPGKDWTVSCPEITSMSGYGLVYRGFETLIYGSGIFAALRMVTGAVRQGSDT